MPQRLTKKQRDAVFTLVDMHDYTGDWIASRQLHPQVAREIKGLQRAGYVVVRGDRLQVPSGFRQLINEAIIQGLRSCRRR